MSKNWPPRYDDDPGPVAVAAIMLLVGSLVAVVFWIIWRSVTS